MSQFNGRWSLSAVDQALAFYQQINSPDEYKAKLTKLAEAVKNDPSVYVEELTVEASTVHRKVFINGEKTKDNGPQPIGKEVDAKLGDGRPSKTKLVKESDTKIVRTEVTDSFTITTTFEVKGDELVVTMSSGGVTTTEKYKRVG